MLARHGQPLPSASSSPLVVFSSGEPIRQPSLHAEAVRLNTKCHSYDTGTISGILAMPYWQNLFSTGATDANDNRIITPQQESSVVSILSAGTFFGALSSPFMADTIGRRWALIIAAGIFFDLGVILQTASTALPTFLAGRFFAGFGVGQVSALIPLYQSETAPKWIRGAIVGAYKLAITIGLLIAACVNYATQNRDDTGSYRIPIAVQFAWAIILVVGMLFLPETPRFLVRKGNPEKAARSLSRLRRIPADHPAIQAELTEIVSNHEYELSLGKSSYIDCFRGGHLKRQLTGCGLQALQQLTGINFICKSSHQFLPIAHLANESSLLRNPVLQELRHQPALHHSNYYVLHQYSHHRAGPVRCGQVWTTPSLVLGCCRHVCEPVLGRHAGHLDHRPES